MLQLLLRITTQCRLTAARARCLSCPCCWVSSHQVVLRLRVVPPCASSGGTTALRAKLAAPWAAWWVCWFAAIA